MRRSAAGHEFRTRAVLSFGITATVIALASALAPITYDEGEWLSVARRMSAGASLYEDVVDNKSPPIYWAMRAVDAFPGPFVITRGLLVAALATWLGVAGLTTARKLGVPEDAAARLGFGITVAAAIQSGLVLNIELGATALVIGGLLALAGGRPTLAGAVAAGGIVIDPRSAVLVLGVVLFAKERLGLRGAAMVTMGGGWILAWVAYLTLSPDAFYAVIELNAATRGTFADWRPAEVFGVALIASLPAAAAFLAATGRASRRTGRAMRRSPSASVLLIGAVIVSFASAFPFYKYWIMTLPSLPLLVAAWHAERAPEGQRLPMGLSPLVLVILAALPAAAHAANVSVDQARRVSRYERASKELRRLITSTDTFVAFDTHPFMTTFLPSQSGLPWAVLDFLAVENSRREQNMRIVEVALDQAAVIVDDGALSAPPEAIKPALRPLWRLFHRRLGMFPCVRQVQSLTLRLRDGPCDARLRPSLVTG